MEKLRYDFAADVFVASTLVYGINKEASTINFFKWDLI